MRKQTPLQSLTEPLLNEPHLTHNEPNSSIPKTENALIDVKSVEVSEHQTKSKNINFILIYSFLVFAGRSTWNQTILSAFVFLLKNDNPEYVGLLTGIMGVSQLLTSFPAGILADKYRRDSVLKIASGVGFIASLSTIIASIQLSFRGLEVSLAIWGIFWGISKPPLSALFADSMSNGEMSHYFTQRMIAQFMGSATGPIVSIVMFSILGDDWNARECAVVMCVGNLMCIPGVLVLCFLSDDYCILQNSDEEEEDTPQSTSLLVKDGTDNFEDIIDRPETSINSSESLDSLSVHSEEVGMDDSDAQRVGDNFLCISETKVVPILVSVADFSSALASGMSIRYFPIFLLDNLKLKPIQVQIVYLLGVSFVIAFSKAAHYGGERVGRLFFTALTKWIGISMMIAMIISYQKNMPPIIICIFFILRMAFMNSTGALTKSVLMDAVPKNERAKWSSLESVNMFNWSGSAALGGVLVNVEGIVFNFYVTAAFQMFATVPLMILVWRSRIRNMGTELRRS